MKMVSRQLAESNRMTAIKTISARIRGSLTDLDELGENTEELAQGFSKYADELKALTGFDIRIDGMSDSYKDLFDIFEGLSQVWNNLSDTQQARVAEILGGTRQLQVVSSILTNWKDAAGAYEAALNSAGVATQANAIVMETAEAKLNRMKAAFQELSGTVVDSEFMGTLIDVGTKVVEIFNGVFNVLSSLARTIPGQMAIVTSSCLAFISVLKTIKTTKFGTNFVTFFKDLSSA